MRYEKVLVAVDIGLNEARPLIAAAIQFTDPNRLTVAHVICLDLEHYARTDRLHGASMDEAYWCTGKHLETLCTPLGLDGDQQRILEGNIVEELAHLVEEEGFDLVIIGLISTIRRVHDVGRDIAGLMRCHRHRHRLIRRAWTTTPATRTSDASF